MTKVTFEKDDYATAMEIESMAAPTLVYLVQYGFKQSLSDCIAGREKAVRAECVKKGGMSESDIMAAIGADLTAQLDKRVAAFKEGNPPSISSRIDPITALAREMVTKSLRKKGKRVTREKYDSLVTDFVANKGKELAAELAAREKRAKAFDVEIAD